MENEKLKQFTIFSGEDTMIRLQIDPKVITKEKAWEMNGFWANSASYLEASNGDVYEAIARRVFSRLVNEFLEGWNTDYLVERVSKAEGWGYLVDEDGNHGIVVLEIDVPDFDGEYAIVEKREIDR